jgi:AAA15 family ATPase/GTPase
MTSKINELTLEYYIGEKRHTGKVTFINNDFNITPFIPFQNYDSNFKAVYVPPAFHSFSPNLEKRLEQLINSKQEHEIIEILNKVDNKIQGISFGLNRMINIDIGLDRLIPLNLLGEGIRRLLTIVLSIYDAKDGIVMIDELENGLHFSTLKCLWRAVVYSSKKYNAQIFATSHNYETLKYLMEVLDEPENEKYQDEVRNFTIRKISELEHKSYCYKFPEFHHAIEEGIELR